MLTDLAGSTEMDYEPDVRAALARMGLVDAGTKIRLTALTGGVSSRILLAETDDARFCFKQALSKLKVRADWYAPVTRIRAEVAWMGAANALLPSITPMILGEDRKSESFAMAYLEPTEHPLWKACLQAGSAAPDVAVAAGRVLLTIHAATAGRRDIADAFANADQFHSLRTGPFLLTAATANPSVSAELRAIAAQLDATTIALVHGDYSPKNILLGGPQGIVVLDAECATYGDPAFDLAFCLSHLLLKAIAYPAHEAIAIRSFVAMADVYRSGITWESASSFEQRLARLLPALMLARVDGKSPVEYLDEPSRDIVRRYTRAALLAPNPTIDLLLSSWTEEVCARRWPK